MDLLFGLARSNRLESALAEAMNEAKVLYEKTGDEFRKALAAIGSV